MRTPMHTSGYERIPTYDESEREARFKPRPRSSSLSHSRVHTHTHTHSHTETHNTTVHQHTRSLLPPLPSPEELDSDSPQNYSTHARPLHQNQHPLIPFPSTSPTLPKTTPPPYTPINPHQTTFVLYGSFIHSPTSPAYQINSSLSAGDRSQTSIFRIRRLRARELVLISQASNVDTGTGSTETTPHIHTHTPPPSQTQLDPHFEPLPVPKFDNSNTLYELSVPASTSSNGLFRGQRRSCIPGVIEMKKKPKKWVVKHAPRPGATSREILRIQSKSGGEGKRGDSGSTQRREYDDAWGNEERGWEWKNSLNGKIVAVEGTRRIYPRGVEVAVPVIELSDGLDKRWRELVLSLWAARLWVEVRDQNS